MRIRLDMIFAVVAVCRVDVCAHTKSSGITIKLHCSLPTGRSEVATNRYLRGHEPFENDGERVGSDPADITEAVKAFFTKNIEQWLSEKSSPTDILKLLKLDNAEKAVIHEHSNVALFDEFVKKFNKANPEKAQTLVIKIFTNSYGDKGLFNIIEAARQVPKTARQATRWQERLLNFWADNKKEPKDIFKIMELDKAGDKVLEKPLMLTFVKYVNMFNEKHPDEVEPVIFLLSDLYEDTMVHKLIAARKVPSTKKIANQMQAELTLSWLARQKRPDKIFDILELDMTADPPFENPLFAAWLKYVDDYNSDLIRKKKAEVVPVLKERFDFDVLVKMRVDENKSASFGRLAFELKIAQQEKWFDEGLKPIDVESLVSSVNPEKESTLDRAEKEYPAYFKHRSENRFVAKELKTLEDYKGKEHVVKWLLQEYANSKTKKRADKLMTAFFKKWIAENVEPKSVDKWLGIENSLADNVTSELHKKYLKMYERSSDRMYDEKRSNKRQKISE